jgi:hypothetical protein
VVQKVRAPSSPSRALSTGSSRTCCVTAANPSIYVVGLASRVLTGQPVVPYWFDTPSSCFSSRMHPEVFPACPRSDFRQKISSPLMTFRSTRTFYPTHAASFANTLLPECPFNETDSHEVLFPFSALAPGSDQHRIFLFRLCYALRLSQPLSVSFRPAPFRPCFMPVTLLGFFPSEVSPRWNPERLSTPAPLLTLSYGSTPASCSKLRSTEPFPLDRLQGFYPPANPFIRRQALTCHPESLLSWDSSPPRVSLVTRWSCFHNPSSHALSLRFAPRPEDHLTPLRSCPRVFLHATCGLPPKRLPSFLGFATFSLFTSFWNSLRPGSWFHLRPRSTSPPPGRPSSGFAHSDRSKMSRTLWPR